MSDKKKEPEEARNEFERGLRFLHTMGMQAKIDLVALNERVLALTETLVASGQLDLRAYDDRREKVAPREAERMNQEGHVHVMLYEEQDKYALKDLPEIDCEARLSLCEARCCTFGFPLSVQDLDEHVVRWDYGRPYHNRQGDDGYCAHNASNSRGCRIYDQRPAVCRTFDCRKDERIWKDFDARSPADQEKPGGS